MWGLKHVFEALLSRHDNTDKGQKNLEEKYQHVVQGLQVRVLSALYARGDQLPVLCVALTHHLPSFLFATFV
jgi:hypothetical protein